jgi:hypothetical protein
MWQPPAYNRVVATFIRVHTMLAHLFGGICPAPKSWARHYSYDWWMGLQSRVTVRLVVTEHGEKAFQVRPVTPGVQKFITFLVPEVI